MTVSLAVLKEDLLKIRLLLRATLFFLSFYINYFRSCLLKETYLNEMQNFFFFQCLIVDVENQELVLSKNITKEVSRFRTAKSVHFGW